MSVLFPNISSYSDVTMILLTQAFSLCHYLIDVLDEFNKVVNLCICINFDFILFIPFVAKVSFAFMEQLIHWAKCFLFKFICELLFLLLVCTREKTSTCLLLS